MPSGQIKKKQITVLFTAVKCQNKEASIFSDTFSKFLQFLTVHQSTGTSDVQSVN